MRGLGGVFAPHGPAGVLGQLGGHGEDGHYSCLVQLAWGLNELPYNSLCFMNNQTVFRQFLLQLYTFMCEVVTEFLILLLFSTNSQIGGWGELDLLTDLLI